MSLNDRLLNRRTFLCHAAVGAAGVATAGFWIKNAFAAELAAKGSFQGVPADPIFFLNQLEQKEFTGDYFHRAHGILWSKASYLEGKGGIPAAEETVDVVVLGGGLGGLSAAFQLRDLRPLILEQAPQFGGNAKAECWGSTTYSIGSAYFTPPEKGGQLERFLNELGIAKDYRIAQFSDEGGSALFRGELINGFWEGATDPENAEEFRRVHRKLAHVREHAFPEIPWRSDSQLSRDEYNRLDRLSFSEWMQQELAPLHPHVEEFLQSYCWSSLGGQATELSSVQVLNFLTSDLEAVAVFPGGNAAVSQALYSRLKSELGAECLRAGCFVVDVALNSEGVRVCYETREGTLKTIQARTAIIAVSKFIARKWIDALPEEQIRAISQINYRAYLVTNVLLSSRGEAPTYDCYRIEGEGMRDPVEESRQRSYTDVIFGNWADSAGSDHRVLTLYRALPYSYARPALLPEDTFEKIYQEMEADVIPLLEGLGHKREDYRGLRLTRWGHPLPLGRTGLLADGVLEQASAPVGGRVFFAHQDNFASPCFESAFKSAVIAADHVRAVCSIGQPR